MPRTARASVGGQCYHVINRGDNRVEVFPKPEDYEAFVAMVAEACQRVPVRLLAYCLMPNHFHLVLAHVAAAYRHPPGHRGFPSTPRSTAEDTQPTEKERIKVEG